MEVAESSQLEPAISRLVVRLVEGRERGSLPRKVAVRVTRWGIVVSRRAEAAVERARPAAGDIRAAAYADLGESAPPPADRGTAGHDHAHRCSRSSSPRRAGGCAWRCPG